MLLPPSLPAATNDLTSALQKGLFEEEANHNLEAAAQAYRDVSAQFDKDRKVAATAVFRLGEICRKQGKINEAVVQYERIVREFSDQETLATLSRQNLAALGRSSQPTVTAALSPAARAEHRRLLEAEIQLLERKIESEKLLLGAGRTDGMTLITTQRELLALKRQLAALSPGATSEDIRAEQGRLLDEEIGLVEQRLASVRAMATDRENPSAVSDVERELLALKRQRVTLAAEPLQVTTPEGGATLVTDDEEKEIRRIQAMIQNSPDLINASSGELNVTPLNRAASQGQLRVAEFLLNCGANVNLRSDGNTPLHNAVNNGHKRMVEFLAEHGADINARDSAGNTPLHLAAAKGYLSVAEALIERKADVDARNSERNRELTPLQTAVKAGHPAMAELLVSKGANLEAQDRNGMTALSLAALFKQDEIVGKLLALGAKPDVQGVDGRTALSWAASQGSLETARTLLAGKADPNAGTNDLPLLWAAHTKSLEMAELLVRAGADPNRTSRFSKDVQPPGSARSSLGGSFGPYRPLQIAVRQQDAPMVKLLLQFKADAKARSPEGVPLIFDALGSAEILGALLDAGASPNATNQRGETLLHLAVAVQDKAVVAAILARKAEVNGIGSLRVTPLRLATSNYRNKEIADLLRRHGGLEEVPDFFSIRVTRGNLATPTVVFKKDTNALNRFTLFEVLGRCDYVGVPRVGFSDFAVPPSLPFPDFSRIRILRPADANSAEYTEIPALVVTATNTLDCARDMWLEFGDVIDIPEREHSLGEINKGLTTAQSDSLDQCLKRTVAFVIKGRSSEIKLDGRSASAWLSQALRFPEVQSLLRSSSDLSRVKVKRTDPQTKQPREVVMDVDLFWRKQPAPVLDDVWLRDGDVIEVPDKP